MPTDRSSFGAGHRIPFAYPEALHEPEKLLAAYFSSSTVGLGILDTSSAISPSIMRLPKSMAFPHPITWARQCARSWEMSQLELNPSFSVCFPRGSL